jgi:predicted  nucleic acid-binding Zn-ribbon protein
MLSEVFDQLQSLQEILSKKCDIENEVSEIPKLINTKLELLERLKKSYTDKSRINEDIQGRIKDYKQRMDEAEREREKYEQQMDKIKTQREYEALDKQIKDITNKEQDFRKEILKLETQLTEMATTLEKENLMIQKQEDEVKSEQVRVKQEIKEKQKLLKNLEKEEVKITPGLDEDILFKFERIIRSKAGIGIVAIKNGICSGCNIILTPQFVNNVKLGDGIMFCPECSRILFFPVNEKIEDETFSEQEDEEENEEESEEEEMDTDTEEDSEGEE